MTTTRPLILIGAGEHCGACIDVIESANAYAVRGVLDRDPTSRPFSTYPLLGNDDLLPSLISRDFDFLITIGHVDRLAPRLRAFELVSSMKGNFATVVSSRAYVSKTSVVGSGTIVMHDALLNNLSAVGRNCIINSKALLEHDSKVGDHTHISTGAIVNGGCRIGSRVFIGSQAVIAHGVALADDVVIGAGSVVIKNIEEAGTYVGNPVRKIK